MQHNFFMLKFTYNKKKESLMKIAIIYIGIGRYTVFWDEFYKSCEKNFIRNAQKHYFYFTDS